MTFGDRPAPAVCTHSAQTSRENLATSEALKLCRPDQLIEGERNRGCSDRRMAEQAHGHPPHRFPTLPIVKHGRSLLRYDWHGSSGTVDCETRSPRAVSTRSTQNNTRTTVAGISAFGGGALGHPDGRLAEPRTPMTQLPQTPGPPMQPP